MDDYTSLSLLSCCCYCVSVNKDCTVTLKKDIKMAGLAFLAVKRMILLTGRFKVFLKETWLLEVSDFPGCD